MARYAKWVWIFLLPFCLISATKSKSEKSSSKPAPQGPFDLMFVARDGDVYVMDVTATGVKGRAKFGLFEANASGDIVEVVTLTKKADKGDDIVELESQCKIVKSTLKPARLADYACPKEPQPFLMHRLNPFRIGLYPLFPVKVGDAWPYDVQLGQNGYIKANYKFVKLDGNIAEIDAVIDYLEEIPGMIITRSSVNFKGKFWVDVTNSHPVRIEGFLKARNQPTAKLLSGVSFDVETSVKASLRSVTTKKAAPRKSR